MAQGETRSPEQMQFKRDADKLRDARDVLSRYFPGLETARAILDEKAATLAAWSNGNR